MWFRKKKKHNLDRFVTWREFQMLIDGMGEIQVEVTCLRKGIAEKEEHDYLIQEGWAQSEYRYWSRKASKIEALYQDQAYKLAKHMQYKRDMAERKKDDGD